MLDPEAEEFGVLGSSPRETKVEVNEAEADAEVNTETKVEVNIIVAGVKLEDDRLAIGYQGTIPWRLLEDLRYFRQVTLGHVVIMGRRTWESIPATHRPLPGRVNIVVSRDKTKVELPGAYLSHDLGAALEYANSLCKFKSQTWGGCKIFIIGGAELYRSYLEMYPNAWHRLYLTVVKQGAWEANYDTYFELKWVSKRTIKSSRETPEATYEVYERV